jgi:hypothetical protein
MAKQIIDIGVQGNDGTGDSIRDSFRKVNDNFNEIYSIFGQGRITFSQLGDGTSYSGNQLIMGNEPGSTLTARTLIPGSNINIVVNDTSVTVSSRAAQISQDTKPAISNPFNVNLNPIGLVPDPSQELVDAFNRIWDTQTTLDQLPVNVGYANKNYVRLTADGIIGIVDASGTIVPGPVSARSEPTVPDTTNAAYDPTLTGNYLSTEVLPRKNVVYRGGDSMTGPLYLSDHPNDLAGTVGANNKSDLQAATAFYVDNKTYTSNVNLYVATSGDDLQSQTPAGKEGRFWNYAFRSVGSALLHAESLINVASQEPGPYKQRVSYTIGPDQYFSTIKKVTLTGGNSTDAGYVAAFNLLQANKEFIQSETIAYINKRYVNTFAYNHSVLATKITSLLSNIEYDLLLGSTNPNSSISGTNYNSYWEGISYIHNNPTSDGLIQWVDTVNFVRDQIIDFSYDTLSLQAYTSQLIDAIAYDLVFSSNYRTVQTSIAFKNAGTKISSEQLVAMLTVDPISIASATCNGSTVTLTFSTQTINLFPVGSEILINATFISKSNKTASPLIISSYSSGSVVSFVVTSSTTSSVSFAKGIYPFITDQFTVTGTIDRKNLINLLLMTPAVSSLPSAITSVNQSVGILTNYLVNGVLPDIVYPIPTNPVGTSVIFTDSSDLVTVSNHGLANGTAVSFSTIVSTTGISINTTYYVINTTANTFQLSLSSFGTAIVLTTNGTGILSWDSIGHSSARDLLLDNISFIQAETLAFLSAEYPDVTYDRALCIRDVKYIVWGLIYDFMYGGNSQSVYAGKQYWASLSSNYLKDSENTACIASIRHINALVQAIIINQIVGVTYQQSVRQFRNDTLVNGSVTATSLSTNIELIAEIVTNISNVPGSVIYPASTTGNSTLQIVYTAIESTKSVYTTGLTTSTSWFMDHHFPVINDPINQSKIINLFKIITDIIQSGQYPTTLPTYPPLSITVNQNITSAMIDQARTLLPYSVINTIATSTSAFIVSASGPGTADNITINTTTLIQDVRNLVIAMLYDITFGGTSAVYRAGQQFTLVGTNLITQNVINKASQLTVAYITNNITNDTTNKVATLISAKFNAVYIMFSSTVTTPVAVNLDLYTSSTYLPSIALRTLISNNTTAIINDTITYVDNTFAGGFIYDESLCFRDLGFIVDSMAIDLITGGTWQSINSGKSFYKNASARTIAIGGSHYLQSFDGLTFAKNLCLQVLNKQTAVRFQSFPQITTFSSVNSLLTTNIQVTGNISAVVSSDAITKFTNNFQSVLDIIQYGVSVAAVPTYGSGIWHLCIDNGGRGYVDQGAPLNNDIFPAKVVVGVGTSTVAPSNAYASIVKYAPNQDTSLTILSIDSLTQFTLSVNHQTAGSITFSIGSTAGLVATLSTDTAVVTLTSGTTTGLNTGQTPVKTLGVGQFGISTLPNVDTIQVRLTKPGFFTAGDTTGEQLEFGETVRDLNITIFVESGIYYEDYPLRIPPNVSVRGDDARRTLIRPHDRISQSPWRKIFFYRDAIIDALEIGKVNYDGTDFAPVGISASIDGVTNKIVVTLSNNYQSLLSWVGKVFADTNTTNGNSKRGRAVVDSVSGNTFNCTVIYPFTTSGIYAAGSWKLFSTNNFGRHYLTDPLDVTSPAKNNKDIDVFLCNEGNRLVGLTFQGHGGFAMVLDPEGNIKTKSPYIQECTSFSQSNNYKRFAGGQFIDGFVGRVYGTITAIADYGLTVTVVGATNSGLDVRPPQPPCSFYVRGNRYQIDDIVSFDASTKTVVLTLDKSTTYMYNSTTHNLIYDEVKAQRDVGYVVNAAATDAILGTNYRSIHAGGAFLRSYSSALVGPLQDLTIAGVSKAIDLSNEYFEVIDPETNEASETGLLSNNGLIMTSMLANGVNATPSIVWSTSSISDNNKARDIIQNNKPFIKSEISAWIASNFVISLYPTYNVLTSERDIGYIIDAMTYDMFYGGNSQTYDSAISLYFNGSTILPGETSLCAASYGRLKTVLQQVVAGSTVSTSAGNSLTQITTNVPSAPASYATTLGTLSDLIIDYVVDGAFTTTPTVTFPTLPAGTTTTAYNTVISNISLIASSVNTFLKNGANLTINIETGGNRSMLANNLSMFNDLAYGVIATNGAFTEQVCTFTYYVHSGFWANNGSNLRAVGCSNTFGDYGLRASGFDVTELPDSVNLANNMMQTATVYKQGLVINEMTPTAAAPAVALWIIGYDYIPTNGASIEIDHTVNGSVITTYSITSVEYTNIQVSGQIVLKINLSSSVSSASSFSGLAKALYHGQLVYIQSMKNVKFINVDNVKPTRPSTALQYNDNLNDVYRIISYNLTESTGDLLGNNIAILQSDNSFSYYTFTVDPNNIDNGDPSSNISATVVLGSTSGTTLTVNNLAAGTTILVGHVISGIGFAGHTVTNVAGPVSGVYTLTLSSAPLLTPTQTIIFSVNTQGSKIGDTKIAVLQISQQFVIDQINKGTFITAWHGRLHRVLQYVIPTFSATRTFVSYSSPTLLVSGSIGTIVNGLIIIGRNSSTNVVEFTGTVASSSYDTVSTISTITVSNGVGTPSSGSVFTIGVDNNGYLLLSSNSVINNSADGTSAPAMMFNSSTLQTGSVVNKLVTFDIPYNKNNTLPKVDSFITIQGNSTTAYNGSYQISSILDQTVLSIGSTTGYVAGMIITSQYNIITIASGTTFTTSQLHLLSVNDPITSNTTTNGLSSTITYYVKTVPTTSTFTLSLTVGGATITNFTSGTSLQIAIQTPTTAKINGSGSIVQSIDTINNQIVVSPSCWAPAGAPIRAVLAASVLRIDITSGGLGYSQAPLLTINGGSPTQQATATCTVIDGVINQVNLVLRGYGYISQPTITITPAPGTVFTGTPAILTVVLSTPIYIDSTSSSGISTTQMTVLYTGDPGTFGTNTSKNISAAGTPTAVTYNGVSGYSVAYTYGSMGLALTANTWYRITGNSNSLYNGFYQVISSADATHAVLFYPYNPGTYGTGTTSLVLANTSGTSSSLGISKPFDVNSSYTLKIGYGINTGAQVTTRISTCRATGHDFCDIGTGGYSTTNIPYSIYGDPALSRQPTHETLDEGVGRCFYVSTNQDGIFRVGRFFSVDQGTGTVSFSSKISLSNIEGFGFSRGVVVNEFSSDSSMTSNAADSVPVQSAVRGYIDKRLGLDHGGSPIPFASVIGPGFMPLNGSLTMTGDLPLGNHRITGLRTSTIATDAATVDYVNTQVGGKSSLSLLTDVSFATVTLASAEVLIYDVSTSKWTNRTIYGDITLTYNPGTLTLTSSITANTIVNSMVSSSAAIDQSKLSLVAATTRANATGITQANLGVASFNSAVFTSTNGWVDIVASTSTSTGVTFSKMQYIPNGTLLGNRSGSTGSITTVTPAQVVTDGDGIKNALFNSTGVMVVSTVTSGNASGYTVIGYTTSGENSKIVQTGVSGEIDAAQLKVDHYKIIDTLPSGLNTAATTKVILTTPGNFDFLTSVGDSAANTITSIYGTLDVSGSGVNSSLKATTITTGASSTAGTLTGTWTLAPGSSLDTTSGSFTSSSAGLIASESRPKVKPALLFDFANGRTLDPRINFTRGSIATYYSASGLMKTAIVNQPRFDYDPVTGISNGLLLEEQRTNWLTFSASFASSGGSQNWTDTNITRTVSSGVTAPDGTTAIKFAANAANATVAISGGLATGPIYRTFSIWMQRVVGTGTISITMDNGVNWYTVSLTTTLTRYSFTNSTSDHRVAIKIATSGDSIVMWGAQLEDGAFVTTYIPTTTTQVTRTADVAYVDSTNFSRWYRQDEGTIVVSHTATAIDISSTVNDYGAVLIQNSDLSSNITVRCYSNGAGSLVYDARGTTASVAQYDFNGVTTTSVNSLVTHALAYKSNSTSYSYNGNVAETDLVVTLASNMIRLYIGNSNGAQTIAKIVYYSKRLSDIEIQAITVQ